MRKKLSIKFKDIGAKRTETYNSRSMKNIVITSELTNVSLTMRTFAVFRKSR